MLARNLLGAGKIKDAQSAAAEAVSLSRQAALETARYEAILADAHVQAKSGKTKQARRELESMLLSTRKFGYRLYEFQTRLALGEIELREDSATGRSHLSTLEADATAHGALLVANQARALRN